jgi:hypothetical protein
MNEEHITYRFTRGKNNATTTSQILQINLAEAIGASWPWPHAAAAVPPRRRRRTPAMRHWALAVAPPRLLPPCSLFACLISQQYFSLRTNQPPATSQQYSSLRTNQHQPSATSQPNRLLVPGGACAGHRRDFCAPAAHREREAGGWRI